MRVSKQVLSGAAVVVGLGAVALTGYASEWFGAEGRSRLAPFLAILTNADDHRTEVRGAYQFTVHPGFSSRATVQAEGESILELHRQDGIYNLPVGQMGPPSRHAIRLTGGEHARDVGLVVNDPKHQVARVIVEFYADGHQPGLRSDTPVVERLVVDNTVMTCPPYCGEEPPVNK